MRILIFQIFFRNIPLFNHQTSEYSRLILLSCRIFHRVPLASFRQVSSLVWEIARKKSSTFIFFHRIFPFLTNQFDQPWYQPFFHQPVFINHFLIIFCQPWCRPWYQPFFNQPVYQPFFNHGWSILGYLPLIYQPWPSDITLAGSKRKAYSNSPASRRSFSLRLGVVQVAAWWTVATRAV